MFANGGFGLTEKVAVFLPGWIGDAVMATPALRAIRQHFGAARIVWVAKPYVLGALQGSPWHDGTVHSGTSRGAARLIAPWIDGREIARRLGGAPDLAILFSNSMRTGLTAWFSGAKARIGQALHGRGFLLTGKVAAHRDDRGRLAPFPIVAVYNEIAREAGCADPGLNMELFTTAQDESEANAVWRTAGFAQRTKVIGLHAGAAFGAAKLWPLERFGWIARKLAEKGHGVVVIGGPAEANQARELVALAGHPMVKALAEPGMPPLSLGLSKAVVRRADLLLTTDSGPRHFASAFKRAVVTLFGPTHIAWTETWQQRAFHLAAPVPCGPCQQRICPEGHHNCMKLLQPQMVLQVVETVLDGRKPTLAAAGQAGVRACDPLHYPNSGDTVQLERRQSA